MSSETSMSIRTREEWQAILNQGAKVLLDRKEFKIFRMPDGTVWRAMPRWRAAWRVYGDLKYILNEEEAGSLGGKLGS